MRCNNTMEKQINQTIDFEKLSRDEAESRLKEFNISLDASEGLKIQKEFLNRPPTVAECVVWSIQGSEHSSYKSSRIHLKKFNTSAPNVILGPSEDAGIVEIARDNQGKKYGVV